MKRNFIAAPEVPKSPADNTCKKTWPEHHTVATANMRPDHFVERDGTCFAGVHLLLDLWGAKHLDNLDRMEAALRDCVQKCRATLLHIHLHHFSENGGISGVAVLAESHISVHTWPEHDFAAFDIFMCGQARPEEAISVILRAFSPQNVQITENRRGMLDRA